MAIPPVTPLPTPPSRSRPDTFATEADAFLGALDTFGTQLDDLGDAVEAAEIATAASETAAAASETAAAASEAAAATSETNASGSETAAAASAASAAASFDSFDDRYLGPKASDPTTDNDGDPLSGGMIYYNTGSGTLKLYNGSAWTAAVLDANGALLAANNLSDLTDTAAAIANLGITADPTIGTLTQSFGVDESVTITLSSSVSPTAVVAVTKEVGQTGVSSKGAWDVNTTASNYELYDQAPATSLAIGAVNAGDLSTASYLQGFSVTAQETSPSDVFFKSDGTKLYVLGFLGRDVNEYDLSTAWDVSTASYLQNFSVSAQETSPQGLFFKPDGTKMYVVGATGDDVNEYDLSTAWDVTTASYLQNFSVSGQAAVPRAVFFKPDGTKMYISDSNAAKVFEYDLSTAWDVSTASYNSNVLAVSAPTGIYISSDGLTLFATNGSSAISYTLSTAWDISTGSFLYNFSISAQEASATGIFFKSDLSKMYTVGTDNASVFEYDTGSPALILGTGSFSSSDVGKRIFVDDGGEALLTAAGGSYSLVSAFGASSYTSGNWSLTGLDVDATDGITLSLAEVETWDVSAASFVQTLSVAAQDTLPSGVFFKPDGLKMYICGRAGDDVNEYSLSTAWDISTAVFARNFSVSAQATNPSDIFFKPDGTRMYIMDSSGQDVNEYSLSTAWNISTASYVRIFNVSAQEGAPKAVFFKPDGLKMYALGGKVNEYNLSTAWDISTAIYSQNFNVATQDAAPASVFFKTDGLKMYVLGDDGNDVNEYNLSTAWDVSTVVFAQNFSVSAQDTNPSGLFFKSDGTKMYVIGYSSDSVHEYDVGSIYQPTAQYLPAITSPAGQIDSQDWTDINSMTADDADNDGQVYYAVSTDDRTTWSIAKASDGVRDIVRNNGGTWQYNSAEGTPSIENASLVGTHSVTAQDTTPTGIFFKPDGTKMYIGGLTNDRIYEYSLSTAWQVSTASYTSLFSNSVVFSAPRDIFFKPDGTKMYILDDVADDIFEYNLSTAWDITTSSYVQSFYIYSQEQNAAGLFFKPDGTEMYIVDRGGQDSHQYTLSTAWNISTASLTATGPNTTGMHSIQFTSDGLSMYLKDQSGIVSEYALSTAWLISSATATGVTFDSGVNSTGATLTDGGRKLYIVGSNDVVYQYRNADYTTSATWNSATTNNEFASIAEAMTVAANQMDKAQVDAVTDGSHFTLGNTLDLAIVPYLASAGTAPTSDGITLNYDAAALNKGAILGTDYDYDVPAGDKVRITALATNNLKVRIV